MLVYHGKEVEQISPFNFVNFAVIEPDRERICEWLLHLYRFKKYQEISTRIVKFLKIVKPFLNRAFGSELRLIHQIVLSCGKKKLQMSTSDDQNDLKIVAEALRNEIILKEEESKADCLNQALHAFFEVPPQPEMVGGHFQQKVEILTSMLKEGVHSIIVLGERSCKSVVIR